MPIGKMSRLAELLAPGDASDRGEASFRARFRYDRQGLVTIDLAVKAELKLLCQRSLEPYAEEVERRSRLVVIEDVADQEELPAEYEPVLVEDRRLALADLVEEELLLAVPQVPRSPEAGELELPEDVSVETSSAKESEQTHRPFEGLAGLLRKSAED